MISNIAQPIEILTYVKLECPLWTEGIEPKRLKKIAEDVSTPDINTARIHELILLKTGKSFWNNSMELRMKSYRKFYI